MDKSFFASLLILVFILGCQKSEQPTFSLLPGQETFQQNKTIDNKVDIVWVIDNSGSMANLQSQMAANFDSFIREFSEKNFDYKIAITNTNAWKAITDPDPLLSEFNDGLSIEKSGVKYITPTTEDPIAAFNLNVKQGISGTGDERPLQSLKAALDNSLNSDFRREGAFLAIIIVTDEDDFSSDSTTFTGEDYDHPDLHPIDDYISYLQEASSSSAEDFKFSVSGITILDQDCLNDNLPHGNIATRIQEIVQSTNGIQGDVCSDDFSQTLDAIQLRINELATQFVIERPLQEQSITVIVDGTPVVNNSVNGWSYSQESKVLRFHGNAVPAQGATVVVQYEPTTIK